jgi:hypothetical protein
MHILKGGITAWYGGGRVCGWYRLAIKVANFVSLTEMWLLIWKQILIILCGSKMPTRCNRWIFIADLTACSTCFGHHYAHRQELESIIQVVAACRIWCFVFKLSGWCGAEGCVSGLRAAAPNTTGTHHLYNTLELLMMGIMAPETCWASSKICNKNSSVASSWHFISTYYRRCTVKTTSNVYITSFPQTFFQILKNDEEISTHSLSWGTNLKFVSTELFLTLVGWGF